MTDRKLWRNRKERKDWARRLQSDDHGLEVVHPHAAEIDVGVNTGYRRRNLLKSVLGNDLQIQPESYAKTA